MAPVRRSRVKVAVAVAATLTYRQRVQSVIESAQACLTGHDIATRTGLTYRQTVDALNALVNQGRISRTGRKYTARWCPVAPPPPNPAADLDAAIRRFFR